MKRRIFIKAFIGVAVFTMMSIIVLIVVADPWAEKKILAAINESKGPYSCYVENVHVSVFKSHVSLHNITLSSGKLKEAKREVKVKISSIKVAGINIYKALRKKDIFIRKVTVSGCNIEGKIPIKEEETTPIVSAYNIRIDRLLFNKIDLILKSNSSAKQYLVKDGFLEEYNVKINALDTLSPFVFKQFDISAKEFRIVSADSLYSLIAGKIEYSSASKALLLKSFTVQPNFPVNKFTSMCKFQSDCIEAELTNIGIQGFSLSDYVTDRSLVSTYIEIAKMNLNVFRDKRKKFNHVKKSAFQDMIYNYPGLLRIDSISFLSGDVTYSEHAIHANLPGTVSFNNIHVKTYNITNDKIYKTKTLILEVRGEGLLMGKGKTSIIYRGKVFDNYNTFSLVGTLSGMEMSDLNPMLENNAFLYATSGKIDYLNFNFIADNTRSKGKLIMRYHGLNIAFKNELTDDTTAFRERFNSLFANTKILNSNPVRKKDVRVGIIDYNRDPERFLIHYCFHSILTGIKSSLTNRTKKNISMNSGKYQVADPLFLLL